MSKSRHTQLKVDIHRQRQRLMSHFVGRIIKEKISDPGHRAKLGSFATLGTCKQHLFGLLIADGEMLTPLL